MDSNNPNNTTPSGELGLALGLGALISDLSTQQQYTSLAAAHVAKGMTYEQAVAEVNRALAPMWTAQALAYRRRKMRWYRAGVFVAACFAILPLLPNTASNGHLWWLITGIATVVACSFGRWYMSRGQ